MIAPKTEQTQLIRKSFSMSVNPGRLEEYQKRHDSIWPELACILKEHGVHNYSIFYHHSAGLLFAYVEIEDEGRWTDIAKTGVCRRWWRYMSDVMPCNEDLSPVSTSLSEVFHLR